MNKLFLLLLFPLSAFCQIGVDRTLSNDTTYLTPTDLSAQNVYNLIATGTGKILKISDPTIRNNTKTLKISNKGIYDVLLFNTGTTLPARTKPNEYPMIMLDWKNPGWAVTASPVISLPQSSNTALFGPASGSPANASFRAAVPADIVTAESDPIWIAQKPLYQTLSNLSTDLTANANKYPNTIAVNAGLNTKEPTVTAGTTGQYYRGDKTWQTFPSIPAAQVSSDWNSVVSPTQILNKPVIPTNTNQLTNGAGFLTAEVDGSVTNEIELPAQASQSGKFLQTNGTTPSWQTALTAEVDGSVTNEIELPVQTGQANKFLQTNGTVASWQNTTTNVSAPSTGNTFTSGVAFQPSAGTSSFVSAQGSLSGVVGVTGTLVIAVSPTQAGTYTTISTTRYLISVSLVTSDLDTGSIPVPLGYWVRITLTGGVTATYTKWIL